MLILNITGKLRVFLVLCLFLCYGYTRATSQIKLIPMPNSLTIGKGSLRLSESISVGGKGISDETKAFMISQVKSEVELKETERFSGAELRIELMNEPGVTGEYALDIDSEGIYVRASTGEGLLNGLNTLSQILYQSRENGIYILPHLTIKDAPAYEYRGFMLDASRHFQSVEKVKAILDFMSSLKLNVFHWHLTDNEGWRIESRKFPKLNQTGSFIKIIGRKSKPEDDELNGFYTIEQIKEILAYAKQRHIEVIPEVDVPGHNWALLTSYPEYRCPGHPTSNSICGSNPEGIAFIKEVFKEVIEIFNPRYIHIGGDERKKGIWETCPLDQARMKELGIESENDLQNRYLNEITAHIQGMGVTTIAWAENLEGGIPEGQIIQAWHRGDGPMATQEGSRVIVSDHYASYLDYPENVEAKKMKPDWMPVLSVQKVYNFDFTYKGMAAKQQKLIWGGESPLWTENVLESEIYDQIKGRAEAHAERSWTSVEHKDVSRFNRDYLVLGEYFREIINGNIPKHDGHLFESQGEGQD